MQVMGGEDWSRWVTALGERDLLRAGFRTVALSYIGSSLTSAIYRDGTIGAAKVHLEQTARQLDERLAAVGGRALTSVNGAAVTQASTAIPGIALYVSLLHAVLGDALQSPVEQSVRLWDQLTGAAPLDLDEQGRLRLDRWELDPAVQAAVPNAGGRSPRRPRRSRRRRLVPRAVPRPVRLRRPRRRLHRAGRPRPALAHRVGSAIIVAALNKRGPGLNAVTQLDADALKQAAPADRQRAAGRVLGPAHGLPILSVSDAAMTLALITGPDPDGDAEYSAIFGPDYPATGVIPALPAQLPDYMKALDLNFVKGKKIGYNGTLTDGSPLKIAYDALTAAGAIMVPRPTTTVGTLPSLPAGYEQHKTIDEYYRRLGSRAPIQSLVQEVADNQANAQHALKFGNNSHLNARGAPTSPPAGPTRSRTGRTCPFARPSGTRPSTT